MYKDFFPDDEVIIADAHQYLLEHFHEYDFIWSSPPCPSHSSVRFIAMYSKEGKLRQKPVYPDMKLYEEILLLENYFRGRYVVENVISFYDPLIPPQRLGGHYFWLNFFVPDTYTEPTRQHYGSIEQLQQRKGFDLSEYPLTKHAQRLALRNCVEPELGKWIFDYAVNPIKKQVELV